MRTRVLIFCGIVLAVCLWLLLRRAPEQPKTESPEVQAAVTNQPVMSQPAPPPAKVAVAQNPTAQKPPPNFTGDAVQRGSPEGVSEMNQRALVQWQAPINFYGKVVDESNNPVSGANIHFRWSEKPAADGMRTADTESDAGGLFSLQGESGRSLTVWFGKDGYYASQGGQKTFLYALGPDIISPDPYNPIIFHLRKKGQGETLIKLKKNYRVARDGTPLAIDLASGASAPSESGNFVVRCWTQDAGKRSGERYDWRCVLTIPGGGAVTNDDEFAFEAPEEGYVPTLEIAMPADQPGWQDEVDLKFYYHLADGRYGRMTFSMIAGGQHFCMIDSVLNPSGSRNLEPSQ
jgi:hypothetical protein